MKTSISSSSRRKDMFKIAVVVGTRPEAIKMAPVAMAVRENPAMRLVLILTAQHREMSDDVMDVFSLQPDYDLDIMKPNQSLFQVTAHLVRKLELVLSQEKPDMVLVQGDTTSTFVGSLCSYYLRIPVGHVEAGLRTYRKYSPFPEEINRKLTTVLSDLHFAPTSVARQALLDEGIPARSIHVVGNPVIDALLHVAAQDYPFETGALRAIDFEASRVIAVTAHRRESWGKPFENMLRALRHIARKHPDVLVVFPVHPNPNVREPVGRILANEKRVVLVDPLDYREFVKLLKSCYFIITDSGGIQEEAPSLGKPVLLMREVTERPEAVKVGAVKVVGTDTRRIVDEAARLLDSPAVYRRMVVDKNPYGDGKASLRIVKAVGRYLAAREGKGA
jgi:UDP-N-acetylglucosamine 2-epimerase (non-hydrolysing)